MVIKDNDKYHTHEVQSTLLEMMKDVHAFCESNKIEYSLCGGTLLGAIRHNGYIPWDDDIDIMMERPHYENFLKEFKGLGNLVLKRELWVWRIQKKQKDESSTYEPTISAPIQCPVTSPA